VISMVMRQWRRLLSLFVSVVRAATASCPSTLCPRLPSDGGALLYGVMLLQKKIRRTGTIERDGDADHITSRRHHRMRASRATTHMGRHWLATWRTASSAISAYAVVEYSPGYLADQLVPEGHILFCVEW